MQNVIVLDFLDQDADVGELRGRAISGKKEWEGLKRLAADYPDYEIEWWMGEEFSVFSPLGYLMTKFTETSVDDKTDDEIIALIEDNSMVPFGDGYMFSAGTVPQIFEEIVENLDDERFAKYFPDLAAFFAEQIDAETMTSE